MLHQGVPWLSMIPPPMPSEKENFDMAPQLPGARAARHRLKCLRWVRSRDQRFSKCSGSKNATHRFFKCCLSFFGTRLQIYDICQTWSDCWGEAKSFSVRNAKPMITSKRKSLIGTFVLSVPSVPSSGGIPDLQDSAPRGFTLSALKRSSDGILSGRGIFSHSRAIQLPEWWTSSM